jgi:Amt family ammonium transporter
MWGAIATGLFATSVVSGIPYANGLFHGHPMQLWDQTAGILAVGAYTFVVTFILLKVLDLTLGIRVSEEEEELGLDLTQHGERAYTFDESGLALPEPTILPAPPATFTGASQSPAPSGGQ